MICPSNRPTDGVFQCIIKVKTDTPYIQYCRTTKFRCIYIYARVDDTPPHTTRSTAHLVVVDALRLTDALVRQQQTLVPPLKELNREGGGGGGN